jgi:predicted nuclease of predicted toxin-antitoxin system
VLRDGGHDAVHVADIGMLGAAGDAILADAVRSGQVIVCADTDFGELLAVSGATRPSVVLLRSADRLAPDQQAALLTANLPVVAAELDAGAVVPMPGRRTSTGGTAASHRFGRSGRLAAIDRQVPPHLLDDQGHLVRDQPDVDLGGGQDGQAASLSGGGDEQEPPVHLDDGLLHVAGAEALRTAVGQALQPGSEGREMLGVLTAQGGRGTEDEAVPGENGRALDVDHAPGQVVEEPVEVAVGGRGRLQ